MKTITGLALSNDRKNKTRSILIMIAICLTTMLLTIIGTMGIGMVRFEKKNAAGLYGSNYGIFVGINDNQLNEIKRRAEIAEIGFMNSSGIIKGNEKGSFVYADEKVREMFPNNQQYLLEEGNYPEDENEIAASKEFFKMMGYENVKIGDTVSLDYRSDMEDKYHSRDFIIAGITYDNESVTDRNSYVVFCSQDFYNNTFPEGSRNYNVYFTLSDLTDVSMNNIEEYLQNLAKVCGIDKGRLAINNYYLYWILEPKYEVIAVCGTLMFGLVLFAIIVIYNIFQIGVVQKIQEYGKIKALGATKRQMRQLIFREGMFLAIFSVPLGYVLGLLISKACFVWLDGQNNLVQNAMTYSEVSLFSVILMVTIVFIMVFTVLIAICKPMKVVSNISPVEAVRFHDNSTRKNHGMRKGKKQLSVLSLAMVNVTGNKKRTAGTILTMGLSCVLFVVISSCVGNIDTEYAARKEIMYGQIQLQLDYSMNDDAYPENNLENILKNNPLNEALIKEIKEIPEVTNVYKKECALMEINGVKNSIGVINKEDFENMKSDGDLGNMDYDEAVKNKEVFYGWAYGMEEDGFSIGQSVSMKIDNGTQQFEYNGKIAGSFMIAGNHFVIPKEVYDSICTDGSSYEYIWIDCDENDMPKVEQQIKTILGDVAHIEMTTYHDKLASAQMMSRITKLACYLFMAIVGIIGFMNLANTMIINIITKKQEYGVLQAVGMTKRQLNMCLQIQGLIFTVGTVCASLIIGLPLGYIFYVYAKNNGYFGINIYNIPVIPIVVMVVTVAALQAVLSFVLSRNLKKESLVERIRYQG